MFAMLALLLVPSAQSTPSAADVADARCVVAMTSLSEQLTKPEEKAGVDGTMMFYMGKLIGRGGPTAATAAFEAAGKAFDPATAPDIVETCADEMSEAMDGMR